MGEYFTYEGGDWEKVDFQEILEVSQWRRVPLWSGRIGSGVFGLTNCPSGNRGPRNHREVLLALEDEGLVELVELGFIPCNRCNPQDAQPGFWEVIWESVMEKYNLDNPQDFLDKEKLPFDARRLDWDTITNVTGGLPSRVYVPQGLSTQEVQKFANKLKAVQSSSLNSAIPPIGFYDSTSTERFTPYLI